MKKFFAVILTVLIFVLPGCVLQKDIAMFSVTTETITYDTPLPGTVISSVKYKEKTLLLIDNTDVEAQTQSIYIISLDDNEKIVTYPIFSVELSKHRSIFGLFSVSGKLCYLYINDEMEFVLAIIDDSFEIISEINLGISTDMSGMANAVTDGESLYFVANDRIYRVNTDGSYDEIKRDENSISIDCICTANGDLYILFYEHIGIDKFIISKYDKSSDSITDLYSEKTENIITSIFPGDDEFLLFGMGNDYIYGFDANGKKRRIMKREELGYTNGMANATRLGSSLFENGVRTSYAIMGGNIIKFAFSRDKNVNDERRVITLSTAQSLPPDMVETIANINNNNPEFKISIDNITDNGADLDDYKKALLSGNLGDIIIPPDENSAYLSKGVYADLYPLLDNDPALRREDFLPGILSAFETDGQLFRLQKTFGIETYLAEKSDSISPTYLNILKLINDNPDRYILPYTDSPIVPLLSLVNKNTGEFSADDVRNLLLISDSVSGKNSTDFGQRFLDNKGYYAYLSAYNIYDYIAVSDITLNRAEAVPVGLPDASLPVNQLTNGVDICINSVSENKDDAWAAVKLILTDTSNIKSGFPVLTERFYAEMEKAINDNEYNITYDGVELRTPTAEDFETIKSMLENVKYIEQNPEISKIFSEESEQYFAENKSLDDTVSAIMGRLAILYGE
jgi:hypothetical protein